MLGRLLTAAGVAAGLALLAQPAWGETPALEQLPAAIKPAGMSVYLEVPATGVQIYDCAATKADASRVCASRSTCNSRRTRRMRMRMDLLTIR